MIFYIYADMLDDGTIFYVGKGSGKRKYSYKRNAKHDRFWNKYNCKREIIIDCIESEAMAFAYEIFYIDQLKLNKYKYPENYVACNMTDGGEINPMLGRKHSDFTKNKMSLAKIGKQGTWIGKQHSEETKNKMSSIRTGRKQTQQTKNKISQ